jgi:hypothetical protein
MELAAKGRPDERRSVPGLWIESARWDLTWLIGSAVVVPLSLVFVWAGVSSDLMNLVVTLLAGGPHVFSTFLVTYLDPEYRRRHGLRLALVALGVVAFVVFMTIGHFQILLSFFIFAASFHVLQQNAFLADLYRGRSRSEKGVLSRSIDYALLFLSFYPIASYKLVRDDFMLGEIRILIPRAVQSGITVLAVSALFGAAALLWTGKTILEWRRGTLNVPKAILIALTSAIAFLVPAAAGGTRLELAFQTVNVWHSIQYLGIIWLVLAVAKRKRRNLPRFLSSVSGPGMPTARFYAACLAFTSVLLGIVILLRRTDPLHLSGAQYHYLTIFSVLFIHYAFDGYFFLVSSLGRAGVAESPLAALEGAEALASAR